MTRKELIEKGEGLLSVLDGDSPPIKLMLDGECLVFLVRCAVEQMKSAPDGGGKVRLYYGMPCSVKRGRSFASSCVFWTGLLGGRNESGMDGEA